MKHIEISAYKGGLGTTTIACSLAMGLAKNDRKVLLVDGSKYGDSLGILNIGTTSATWEGKPSKANIDGLDVIVTDLSLPMPTHLYHFYDYVIVDAGTTGISQYSVNDEGVYRLCVVSNEYLSLRNTVGVKTRFAPSERFSGLAMAFQEGNALTANDVKNVMGMEPVIKMDYDPRMSRTIDAGLLCHRFTEVVLPWIAPLMDAVTASKVEA